MRKISVESVKKSVTPYIGASDLRDLIPSMKKGEYTDVMTSDVQFSLNKYIVTQIRKAKGLNSRQVGDLKYFLNLVTSASDFNDFDEGVEDLTGRLSDLEGSLMGIYKDDDKSHLVEEKRVIQNILKYMEKKELVD